MYKNYVQFEGNRIVCYSRLIAFPEGEIPENLMETQLSESETLGKYFNPSDGQIYSKYDWKTGVYSNPQ